MDLSASSSLLCKLVRNVVWFFLFFFFSLSLTREKNQILSKLFFVVTAHSFTNVWISSLLFFLIILCLIFCHLLLVILATNQFWPYNHLKHVGISELAYQTMMPCKQAGFSLSYISNKSQERSKNNLSIQLIHSEVPKKEINCF